MIPQSAKCIRCWHLVPAVLLYFGTDGVDGDSLQFRGREVAQKHLVLAAAGVQEPLILVRWQHLGDVAFGIGNAEGLVSELQLGEPGLLELLMPARCLALAMDQIGAFDLLDEKVICSLAERYGVSSQAMSFRLAYLGYPVPCASGGKAA